MTEARAAPVTQTTDRVLGRLGLRFVRADREGRVLACSDPAPWPGCTPGVSVSEAPPSWQRALTEPAPNGWIQRIEQEAQLWLVASGYCGASEAELDPAAHLVHDLKGPLAAVSGAVEVLVRRPKEAAVILPDIHTRLLRLMDGIEEFSLMHRDLSPRWLQTSLTRVAGHIFRATPLSVPPLPLRTDPALFGPLVRLVLDRTGGAECRDLQVVEGTLRLQGPARSLGRGLGGWPRHELWERLAHALGIETRVDFEDEGSVAVRLEGIQWTEGSSDCAE